jgi:hypothetical protein
LKVKGLESIGAPLIYAARNRQQDRILSGTLKLDARVEQEIELRRVTREAKKLEKALEQSLTALLAREGLVAKEGDLEEFAKIIELYMGTLKTLHSVNLGPEEPGPVFRPDWAAK